MAISDPFRYTLCGVGLILSVYAVYVEMKMESIHDTEEEFTALCDIEAIGASCSTVFTLPEGKLLSYFGIVPHDHFLDLPNAALGAIFYTIQLVFGCIPFMVVGAFSTTVFLAYQLTFVLGDLCILCWTTHVINATLFYCVVLSPLLSSGEKVKTKQS